MSSRRSSELGEVGDELCRVERAAAADREHQLRSASPGTGPRRVSMTCDGGSATHVLEHRHGRRPSASACLGIRVRPALPHALVGDEKHPLRAHTRPRASAIFFDAPGSKRMLGGVWKVNGFILSSPVCLTHGSGSSRARPRRCPAIPRQDARVFGIVDRHGDEVDAAGLEGRLERRRELIRCRDPRDPLAP